MSGRTDDGGPFHAREYTPGISIRAYFAGQALQSYLAGRNIGDGRTTVPQGVAESCVR